MDICNQKLQKDVQSILFSQDSYEGFFFLYIRFEQHKTGHAFLSVTHGPWRFWSNTPAKVLVYITLTSFQLKAILAYLRKHWVLALLTFWNTCTRWHLFSKRNKQQKKNLRFIKIGNLLFNKNPLRRFYSSLGEMPQPRWEQKLLHPHPSKHQAYMVLKSLNPPGFALKPKSFWWLFLLLPLGLALGF